MKHKLGGKAHHGKRRAEGGEAEVGNPHVFAEAKGHTIGTIHGEGGKKRMDRKRGGRVHSDAAEDKKMIREEVKSSALKGHASGGKTGSDTHPYTSAHAHGGKARAAGHHEGLHGAHHGHKEHHRGR